MSPKKHFNLIENRRPDRFQATGLFHLLPVHRSHKNTSATRSSRVEIRDACTDKPTLKNGIRDNVQQSLPIIRKNIKNRKPVGCSVVDADFRRLPMGGQ